MCSFPAEFTCASGLCIDIYKRCNSVTDCDDGSDEQECSMIKVSENYDISSPPELCDDHEKPNQIYAQVEIINFDSIDTVHMSVGLTVEISLQWRDQNVDYENAKNSQNILKEFKIIADDEKSRIWLPLPHIIFNNAIIGKTFEEKFYTLGVLIQNKPQPMKSEEPRETLIYSGIDNYLVMKQRLRLNYRCDFVVRNFPFDGQSCDFYISIKTTRNDSIKLTNDAESVTYKGPLVLNEFEIINLQTKTEQETTETSFIYTVHFQRLSAQHLLTTFLQSFLLWLLAYITLYIDIEDFSDRFMGAVTTLLVLAALLSSLGATLPKTAYFKFIDLWFNWFVINIVVIILIHVIVDFILKQKKKIGIIKGTFSTKEVHVKSQLLNQASKLFLFCFNCIFVIGFFIICNMD